MKPIIFDIMKRSIHLLICFIVLGLLASCKKDNNGNDDDRPAYYWSETTCTINGQFWGDCEPSILIPGAKSSETYVQVTREGFIISAQNACDDNLRKNISEVYIRISSPLETESSYPLSDVHYAGVGIPAGMPGYQDTIETNSAHMGELIIDKFEGKRISGRFHFQAYHKQRDSVYTIANGQFEDVFVYD